MRIDTGVRAGDEVGVRYDPMLAKVIAHAEDRDACIDRMAAVLAETAVLGVATNLGFLRWALGRPAFRAGEAGTDFVEREWSADLVPELPEDVPPRGASPACTPTSSPWFELGPPHSTCARRTASCCTTAGSSRSAATTSRTPAGAAGRRAARWRRRCRARCCASTSTRASTSTEGQALVLLEAMKMELAVTAPGAGVVSAVLVAAGELVSRGQALVELDGDE